MRARNPDPGPLQVGSSGRPAPARPGSAALGTLLLVLGCLAPGVRAAPAPPPVRFGLPPQVGLDRLVLTAWTIDDGLPVNSLLDVLYSREGFIWTGTFRGLVRFDGVDFTVFDSRTLPALAAEGRRVVLRTNGINALTQDANGDLWLGTQTSGVLVNHQGRFWSVDPDDQDPPTIRALLADRANRIWVGTGDFGAYRYDPPGTGSPAGRDGRIVAVDHPSLSDVTVHDILEDARGLLWFATEGRGLTVLDHGSFRTYTTADGLLSDAVTQLASTPDGKLWIGTQDGVAVLDDAGFGTVPELAGVQIYRLRTDDFANVWIGAEQGLYRVNALTRRVETLAESRGVPLRSISGITFDHEGSLWLSSYGDGLFKLQVSKFENYSPADGLATDKVNVIYEASSGVFLIGTDNGTVNLLRDGKMSTLELRLPLPDVRVRHFLEDRDGHLWISSYAGLVKVARAREQLADPGRPLRDQTLYTVDDGLPTNQIRFVFEDRRGRLWVATRNAGLFHFVDGRPAEVIDKSTGLRSTFILSFAEDRDGNFLIGTHEGLEILRPDGRIVHFTTANGLPGNVVFNTHTDRDGGVWMVTNGGLGRLFGGEIHAVSLEQGLPAEAVFDLQDDGHGSLWLSSSIGAIRIDRQQTLAVLEGRSEELETRVFDETDGMVHRECTGATKLLESRDGRLWFPTLGGVAVIDPARIPVNHVPPPVVVHEVKVDHRRLDLGSAGPIRELPPSSREYSFRFSALSYQSPGEVEIRYRLRGFDEDWIEADAQRMARYTNLPRGDYTFQVVAANNDGVWNHEGAEVRFRVLPYFYQRPVFYVLSLLVVGLALHATIRWRISAMHARNAQLEHIVNEQRKAEKERNLLIEELEVKNAEMERFTYTVSHDLKSPLFTVQGFLGFLEKDLEADNRERAYGDIAQIRRAVSTMSRLLDELLELSRIGRVVNPPETVALTELVREAQASIAGRLAERRAEFVIDPLLPPVTGDRVRLLEIFQNLLDNAVKFMGDQPEPRIEVSCRRDSDETVFLVRDNGLGIDAQFHDKVFGLFDRLETDQEGTGIGLAIVQRIVEVHGGRIWVESEGRGRGTTFCFTLPVES